MKPVLAAASIVFALVALAHASRRAMGWDVRVASWSGPRWGSVAGVAVPGLLSIGLARAARGRERTGS